MDDTPESSENQELPVNTEAIRKLVFGYHGELEQGEVEVLWKLIKMRKSWRAELDRLLKEDEEKKL